MVECSMIISTIESLTTSPCHFIKVENYEVVEDFTVFICAAADVEEIAD